MESVIRTLFWALLVFAGTMALFVLFSYFYTART